MNKFCGALLWVVIYIDLILGLTLFDYKTTYFPISLSAYNLSYEIIFTLIYKCPSWISFIFYCVYVGLDLVYFVISLDKDECFIFGLIMFLFCFIIQIGLIMIFKWDPRDVRYLILIVYILCDIGNVYKPSNISLIIEKTAANTFYSFYCFFKNNNANPLYAILSVILFCTNFYSIFVYTIS